MAKKSKTLKAVASINARFAVESGSVEFALAGETGQWYSRETSHPLNGDSFTTKWAACASPLSAFGIPEGYLENGDWRSMDTISLPHIGPVYDVFACGDIGHRYRLPRL